MELSPDELDGHFSCTPPQLMFKCLYGQLINDKLRVKHIQISLNFEELDSLDSIEVLHYDRL
jgi:hypothetical protein